MLVQSSMKIDFGHYRKPMGSSVEILLVPVEEAVG